jgi:hypothetical protein
MRLTTACGAGLGPPGGNRLVREPHRETSPLAQGRVILRPVRDPVPLLGDAVTASGIDFEWHGRIRNQVASSPMPSRSGRQIAYSCNKAASHVLIGDASLCDHGCEIDNRLKGLRDPRDCQIDADFWGSLRNFLNSSRNSRRDLRFGYTLIPSIA